MKNTLSRVWKYKAAAHISGLPVKAREQSHVFMLFIGFCAALTTFLLLDLSTNSLVRSKNEQIVHGAVRSYFDVLDQRRLAADSIGGMLELSSPEDIQRLKYKFSRETSADLVNGLDFVGVYYLAEGQSVFENLYSDTEMRSFIEFTNDSAALAKLYAHERLGDHQARIFAAEEFSDGALLAFGFPDISNQPFVFVKKIELSFSEQALVVAVSHFDEGVYTQWQRENPIVEFINIRAAEGNAQLFLFERQESGLHVERDLQSHKFAFGGLEWIVYSRLQRDGVVAILEFIPFSGMFLVGFLSMLAAFHSLWQQKQAMQMQKMNLVLEEKNAALEHEIEKRESLNLNLKKSEQENRAVIDSISDIIFETNIDGDLLYANASWPRITGFSVMQSKGKNLFSLLHPEDQEKERERFKLLVQGQKAAYRSFTRLRTYDGTFRAVELSISVMRRSTEGQMHVVGAMADIEERRRAEQALGEAERKYRKIVENAAWGIFQMTPEGIYLSANGAMVKILGYASVEEMLHKVKNAHVQVYGNERERKVFLREVDVRGMINNHEIQVHDKDGHSIWVTENIRAVKDDNGQILYYEGSLEDITDRKESDLMLREAKLHSDMANRAKSEFLTNMSHELRTPLNAIIGFSDILKSETYGPLGHKAYYEYVNDINKSGQNLLTIINEILEISRIEVRERDLNEEVISLERVIESCLSLLGNKIHSNRIEILNAIDSSAQLVAEERAMKQIFTNILSNAVKFTPRGGRVTIHSEITKGGDAVISITDTGVGLEPDQIKKALSPFGQVGSSLDGANSGTGLGLTLVKALVDLHGGRLEIFSQKGMGTTVTVRLPAKRVHIADKHVQEKVGQEEGADITDQV
jgi:PAS domain S-box-containing protein